MEFIRINNIEDPLFAQMHALLGDIFPPEEVLEFELWKEPLEDSGIRVFVAVHEGKVVGATEYRYYPDWNIAMTDFTIIGQSGLASAVSWRNSAKRIYSGWRRKMARHYLACSVKSTTHMNVKTSLSAA